MTVVTVSFFDVTIPPLYIYNLLYINYLYILYKGYCHSFFNCHNCHLSQPLVFLYKAIELDVNQVDVSPSESQIKIQRILNSRFKPRRALLFASEVEIYTRGILSDSGAK